MGKSRLSQHKQNKLIELFVAGVTVRTASELVNVNKNTADYYFRQLCLLIYQTSLHLEMFEEEVEVDEGYFGGVAKENVVAVQQEKLRYLDSSNGMARFIPLLYLMLNQQHYCQLSARKLSLIA